MSRLSTTNAPLVLQFPIFSISRMCFFSSQCARETSKKTMNARVLMNRPRVCSGDFVFNYKKKLFWDSFTPKKMFFLIIWIINFRGYLADISAKTATLVCSQKLNRSCIESAADSSPLQPPNCFWKIDVIITGATGFRYCSMHSILSTHSTITHPSDSRCVHIVANLQWTRMTEGRSPPLLAIYLLPVQYMLTKILWSSIGLQARAFNL